ncbi:hypothetical protein LJR034_009107 [Caballeronia sp. LjRoot34]|uniref:hypothetical protein n=1 Tax=Caballeronia sp. LjRoot34 TaxID=3342325 RepID=UPI003ECFEAF5
MANKFVSTWFKAAMEGSRSTNFADYASTLQKQYEAFDAAGYDVISVVPILTGTSETINSKNKTFLAEPTFSITRGAVVIGKRRE